MTREQIVATETALRYLRRVVARGPVEEAELLQAIAILSCVPATPVTSR